MHCITNAVAQNFTANVLLAAGCVPSMTLSPEEIGAFVAGADASSGQSRHLRCRAPRGDRDRGRGGGANKLPWVLDPVFIERSAAARRFRARAAGARPKGVRLNHAEFAALGGGTMPRGGAGFCAAKHMVVALSGETDLVADGARVAASPTAIR